MLAALAACWLAASLLATLATARYLRGLGDAPSPDPGPFPPVLVLLPVRSTDAAEAAQVGACLAALTAQDYPGPWRACVIFEDAADPAWRIAAAADPARFAVLAAGPTPGRAQKLHNLLAGLARREPGEAILATLDADTLPPPGWLAELTRPLRLGLAEAASGYRWPMAQGVPARLLALAERGPATFPRPRWLNLCWGGSTALSAAALQRLDLPALWNAAVSDDLTLTGALRAAGMPAWTPRRVLLPTPVALGWLGVLGFGRRQYMLVRLHALRRWLAIGVTLLLPLAGAVAALAAAATGEAWAVAALATGLLLQQHRAGMRAEVARRVLPPVQAAAVMRALPRDRLLLPLVLPLQAAAFLASAFGRRIRWGGRVYAVAAPDRVGLAANGL
ncbi:glycosyltransferase family 2 protein [Roseomonas sp. AR75]|uniref:glycosyltransferase family 2 protein n=1 Tax=Roseomonas sp. AR75 TaxID=2562311 RepID=UPI0014852F92|nr:glycosyltransferase family 2 protein [Roseomonas sp. AR75]